MTLYFCISEVLDELDKAGAGESRLDALIPVVLEPPDCGGHREDAFTLSSFPRMLDLREPGSEQLLAELLDNVPLYNINMELILDEALSERHDNAYIETALNRAFDNQPLPNTLKPYNLSTNNLSGGLSHPMLGHLEKAELCRIYIRFIAALDRNYDQFGFERNILGKHSERFTDFYDGFVTAHEGKVKAEILLAFGQRLGHDPSKPIESYTGNGKKLALKMRIEEPHELVWAWMEADNHQMRHCRDLDRILRVRGLPKMPNWVRSDIFNLLEKEAMKQVFASLLAEKDRGLTLLESSPALKQALGNNAAGQTDDLLKQLLTQTLNAGTEYAGAAASFVEGAEKRAHEFIRSGLR